MSYSDKYSEKAIEQAKALLRGEQIDPSDIAGDLKELLDHKQGLAQLAHDLMGDGERIHSRVSLDGVDYNIDEFYLTQYLSEGTATINRKPDGTISYEGLDNNKGAPKTEEVKKLEEERQALNNKKEELETDLNEAIQEIKDNPINIDLDKLSTELDDEDSSNLIDKIKDRLGGTNIIDHNILYKELEKIISEGGELSESAQHLKTELDDMLINDPDTLYKIVSGEDAEKLSNLRDKMEKAYKDIAEIEGDISRIDRKLAKIEDNSNPSNYETLAIGETETITIKQETSQTYAIDTYTTDVMGLVTGAPEIDDNFNLHIKGVMMPIAFEQTASPATSQIQVRPDNELPTVEINIASPTDASNDEVYLLASKL